MNNLRKIRLTDKLDNEYLAEKINELIEGLNATDARLKELYDAKMAELDKRQAEIDEKWKKIQEREAAHE